MTNPREPESGTTARSPREEALVRYTFSERMLHAMLGLVFVYLLLTGLALWTPALYWIAVVLGGGMTVERSRSWAR